MKSKNKVSFDHYWANSFSVMAVGIFLPLVIVMFTPSAHDLVHAGKQISHEMPHTWPKVIMSAVCCAFAMGFMYHANMIADEARHRGNRFFGPVIAFIIRWAAGFVSVPAIFLLIHLITFFVFGYEGYPGFGIPLGMLISIFLVPSTNIGFWLEKRFGTETRAGIFALFQTKVPRRN